MINRLKKSQAGFTLIELMIVVAIVGILSAIAIPNYLSYRTSGADASAKSEARNFYTTALAQVADTGEVTVFSNATSLPVGFTKSPDVTMAGDISISAAGVVSSTLACTFVHGSGVTTYTLASDGSITGA